MSTLPCRTHDPELWFGSKDSGPGEEVYRWEWAAMELCWTCPAEPECLAKALTWPADHQHGVVGGMTASQRRQVLRRRSTRVAAGTWDELTVEQLVAGERVVHPSGWDLARACVVLRERGWTTHAISRRLGIGTRRVDRWLHRHRTGQPLVMVPGKHTAARAS